MGKQVKWISRTGEELSKKEIEMMFLTFLERPESVRASIDPPKDLREFESRIAIFEEKVRDLFFGFNYDISEGKTLKRDKRPETIVEALCNYDKYVKAANHIFNEQLQPLFVFFLALEKDAPFVVCDDTYLLGFMRDRSGLSLPQKNMIAIQSAAQILWYQEKNKIPTIDKMKECLQNKKNLFYSLLQINRFNSRTIMNWIREVFPVPMNARKGRTSKNGVPEEYFNRIELIPNIFLDERKKINLLKLRFAIKCITRILKTLGWAEDRIKISKLLQLYQNPIKFHPCLPVSYWIDSALEENGSIFGS